MLTIPFHMPAHRSTPLWWFLLAMILGWVLWLPGDSPRPLHLRTESANAPITEENLTRVFETTIRQPAGPPMVSSGLVDPHGQPVMVNCNTCHATKVPHEDVRVGTPLLLFHQSLKGKHGNLTCVSCHNTKDGYASLRLADGKKVAFPDVMQLCAQCHGTQYRDYQHGAHGGMTGHWDLSKGPRQRNNCTDCHDPHLPKYPTVRPAPGPQDRALTSSPHTGGGHE